MRDCFKWGSQIWHIIPFPNNSFQNPCCVPCSSLSNPIKIPDGAYIVKIWHAIPCFFNKCFHLPPAIPILVPIVFPKYSHIAPGSFPDRSHIFPRSFPVLHPVPIQVSQHFPMLFLDHSQFCPPSPSIPKIFPAVSLSFPRSFPTSSHGFPRSFAVLSPPLWFFLIHVFPNLFPWFPRSFLDLATCQALSQIIAGKKNKPIPDCFPGNPKVFPAHSVTSLAKRFVDSIVILLVPACEAAPYWSSQSSDPKSLDRLKIIHKNTW